MVSTFRDLGRVVYLHSSLKGILSTLKQHPDAERKIKKCLLLKDMAVAKERYHARLRLYRKVADYEIKVEGRQTSEVVLTIRALLPPHDGV